MGRPQPIWGPAVETTGRLSFLAEPKLGGAILLFEGAGSSKEDPKKQVHHALAVLVHDSVAKEYRSSSFVTGRSQLSVPAIEWTEPSPAPRRALTGL